MLYPSLLSPDACIRQPGGHQGEQQEELRPLVAIGGIVPFRQGVGVTAAAAAANDHARHT